MSYKPIATYGPVNTNADNATVFEITGNGQDNDTYQLGSTGGAMDVFGSGDGTNYLSTALTLIDMCATTSLATTVIETAANRHYLLRGRFKKILVQQKGATAVANAYLIATESA